MTTSTRAANRLSYTRKDVALLVDEGNNYIQEFVPAIKDTAATNDGGLFLRYLMSLNDKLHYALDRAHREGKYDKARELKNLLSVVSVTSYINRGPAAATTTVTLQLLAGPAGVGGVPCPQWTTLQSQTNPPFNWLTTAVGTVLEGENSVTAVPIVQGTRTTSHTLSAASVGGADQRYRIDALYAPYLYITVRVAGVVWTRQDDLWSSDYNDQHYYIDYDSDNYAWITFGDDIYGAAPSVGASIDCDYIACSGGSGKAATGEINKITDGQAATFFVLSEAQATGGSDGDTIGKVRTNAPLQARTLWRAVATYDYAALATNYPGVYNATVGTTEGAYIQVYIMPDGGGSAPAPLLANITTYLQERATTGALPAAYALYDAYIQIEADVVLLSAGSERATARSKCRNAIAATKEDGSDNIDGELYFENVTAGRGFVESDISSLLEAIDNNTLVDYVIFRKLTRVPRVTKSRVAAPDIQGRVYSSTTATYNEWSVQAITTTTFQVAKDGIVQAATGTVATEYTSDNSEVTFTIGVTGNVFVVGDTYYFRTSVYNGPIYVDAEEVMALELESDFQFNIYLPGEYTIGTTNL